MEGERARAKDGKREREGKRRELGRKEGRTVESRGIVVDSR